MTARDDAVAAAVEALDSRVHAYGLNRTEVEAIAETAVAAAAPILLAAERARGGDVTEPDYKAMYEAERDKFQGETRVSSVLAERLRAARSSANRCDQCRQARGEGVVRRGDEILWLCHPCTVGTRADVPPLIAESAPKEGQ